MSASWADGSGYAARERKGSVYVPVSGDVAWAGVSAPRRSPVPLRVERARSLALFVVLSAVAGVLLVSALLLFIGTAT